MIAQPELKIAFLVVGLVPLLWSGLVAGLRRIFRARGDIPQDGVEKFTLGLMLVPVFLGPACVALAMCAPASLSAPLIAYAGLDDATSWSVPVTSITQQAQWPVWGDVLWLLTAMYIAVAMFDAARLVLAHIRLKRIISASDAAHDLGEGVRLTGAQVPAFATQSHSIVLPYSLAGILSPEQTAMVIAHERAHLSRNDPLYFLFLSWLDALFWFNLFLRQQTMRARLAAELACDTTVVRARPDLRHSYASALLLALKQSAADIQHYAPAIISSSYSGDFRMRLGEIMRTSSCPHKSRWLHLALGGLLILPVAGLQLAWAQGKAPLIAPDSPSTHAAPTIVPDFLFKVMPTTGILLDGYGMRLDPFTHKRRLHDGVDIDAAVGTPVYAPAPGKVIRVDMSAYGYGHMIEIEHAQGIVTRFMHLSEIDVHVGDQVQAGQEIAKSGNTGRSTGPHTHVGVFKNGKPIDPAMVMPLPGKS